jgi:DNA-binding beta-propeller fold protein YncE
MKKHFAISLLALLVFLAAGCRKTAAPIPEMTTPLFTGNPSASPKGMYLLNEGNFNSNKASLDYLDYLGGVFDLDLFGQANPQATKGLGDVGNDIGIYGSKVYIVVNNSNKVEVLDLATNKHLGQVDIVNCRNITFYDGKAYVSAYLGQVANPNDPAGIVAEIDTTTLTITRQVTVGRQPEKLAVVNGKLYVANSGNYSPADYEHTVSVIDLANLTEIRRIDVAIDLDCLLPDGLGNIYVTSRGDNYSIPSDLFVIDCNADTVKKDFHLPASAICIDAGKAYILSTDFNSGTGKTTIAYSLIDINTATILPGAFITDGTDKQIAAPYGITVNPSTKEILVTDAKDFVSPGTLYCFDPSGKKEWSTTTGDIPADFAFVY